MYYDYDYYDFDKMYYEPSIANDIFNEAKEKLKESIKDSIKNDLNKIKEENEKLKQENRILKDKLLDIDDREKELKLEKERYKNNFEQKLLKGKFSEIFKLLEENMYYYRIERTIEYKDKCNKCDENRLIHFTAPNGQDMTYECDCNKHKNFYKPKKCKLTKIFMTKDKYDKSKLFNFRPSYDYYSDYDERNVSIYPEEIIIEFRKDLIENLEYNQLFSTKEVCQQYCDELNKNKEYK